MWKVCRVASRILVAGRLMHVTQLLAQGNYLVRIARPVERWHCVNLSTLKAAALARSHQLREFESPILGQLTRADRRQQFAEVFSRCYEPFLDIDLLGQVFGELPICPLPLLRIVAGPWHICQLAL